MSREDFGDDAILNICLLMLQGESKGEFERSEEHLILFLNNFAT